jgi:hypothetical protein
MRVSVALRGLLLESKRATQMAKRAVAMKEFGLLPNGLPDLNTSSGGGNENSGSGGNGAGVHKNNNTKNTPSTANSSSKKKKVSEKEKEELENSGSSVRGASDQDGLLVEHVMKSIGLLTRPPPTDNEENDGEDVEGGVREGEVPDDLKQVKKGRGLLCWFVECHSNHFIFLL